MTPSSNEIHARLFVTLPPVELDVAGWLREAILALIGTFVTKNRNQFTDEGNSRNALAMQ